MSETDNKPTLGRRPLGLKTSVQAGEVKQTFSHGRTNKVVVEVKRRKLMGKPGEAPLAAPVPAPVAAPPPPPPAPPPVAPRRTPMADAETRQEMQSRLLREAEEARMNSLELTSRREAEQRARTIEDEKRRAEGKGQVEEAPAPVATVPAAATPAVEAPAPATAALDTRPGLCYAALDALAGRKGN